jgi:hypothetical protein
MESENLIARKIAARRVPAKAKTPLFPNRARAALDPALKGGSAAPRAMLIRTAVSDRGYR